MSLYRAPASPSLCLSLGDQGPLVGLMEGDEGPGFQTIACIAAPWQSDGE